MDFGQLAFFAFMFFSFGMAVAYLVLKLAGYEKGGTNSSPENPPESQPGSYDVVHIRLEKASNTLLVDMSDGQRLELKLKKGVLIEPALTAATGMAAVSLSTLPAAPQIEEPLAPTPTPTSPLQANPPPAPILREPEIEKPKINVVDSFFRVVQSANLKAVNAPPLSIAQQIDAILQQQIANAPAKQRGLRLVDLADHTLGVQIDRQTYTGIDAVPDEDIRSLIQAAVAEWQAQNNQR